MEWVERSEMFEGWARVMEGLGAARRKHWWTELWERSAEIQEEKGREKAGMQQT